MKNGRILLLSLTSLLMGMPLGGRLCAQWALRSYKYEVLPMQPHVFSSDAKVFGGFSDGDSIFRLWLKTDGTTERLEPVAQYTNVKPAAKTGNASLPGFYFGEKEMKFFGLTGGGLVYFGETDELRPTYNPATVLAGMVHPSVVEDLIFIRFRTATATGTSNAEVLATANTSVQYEINTAQDTLFVAYNKVKLLDAGNNAFECSFQYAFTKGGEVLFIPVEMRPQQEPDAAAKKNIYYFNYGLYSKKDLSGGCFLFYKENYEGGPREIIVKSGSYSDIEITRNNYPAQTYRMYPPPPCVAVEHPEITWSYTAATDYIELTKSGAMKWNEGQTHCLFIVSEKATLSGADLPVDGTEYSDGDKIGSSLHVVKGMLNNGASWLGNDNKATGLAPGTTYYLHAFPYSNDCAGIRYNTTEIPSCAVTTAIRPVDTVWADPASVTESGFTLHIDKGDAERYLLAVSHRQMMASTFVALSPKEGGYKAGDRLTFAYNNSTTSERYELEVLTAAGTDALYTVTDAEPNTDYYYYVWSTDASQSGFSFETRTCGVATPYRIPAVFSFDSAAAESKDLTPAGWTLPLVEDRSFYVSEQEGGKCLTAALRPQNDGKALRIEALSPVVKGGKTVHASVDFYFGKMSSTGLEMLPSALRKGDTVYIQYKGLSESAWTTLSTVTAAEATGGAVLISTRNFYLSGDFQLRFVAVSTQAVSEEEGFANASIRRIRVATVCNALSSEPKVAQIMNDRATLEWEDEDNTPRAEAYHLRYRLSQNDAWTGYTSKNRNYTVTRLKNHTYYTMEVAAVCAAGDTSDYTPVSFTTLRGLPYAFTQGNVSEDVTFKTGVLSESGPATLSAPDAEKTVWTSMQKPAGNPGIGLTTGATLNNPLWLNLPVLSTGVLRGKARLSLRLSAWSEADPTQAASFGQTDTLLVLFSTDTLFNRTDTKATVALSEITPQGKIFAVDFEVEDSYQYWAVYTGLQTAGNVLFIDSLRIEWTEIYCNAATGIRHSNLSYRSVDISWKGEGEEYGIFYNNRNTDKWDTVYTRETSYTLDNLVSGVPYQYYIVVYCDADRLKASDRSAVRYFQTEIECQTPTLQVVEGSETWQGVTVITHSNEKTRQFHIEPKDSETYLLRYSASNGEKDTTRIAGLYNYEAIPYLIKVRAICPRDTSAWSETKEFTTLPFPECGSPTDLKAEVNVAAKTAALSWKAGENNLSYAVYIRAGNASRFDTIYTGYPSLTIPGLVPDVVYTWRMKAACEDPLYSKEVEGTRFGTNVGVESVQGFDKAFKVRVFEDQIVIENNEGLYIRSLQAFSTDGRLLRTYPVNSAQNVYIYHSLPKGAALLRVLGENGKTATYKAIIL